MGIIFGRHTGIFPRSREKVNNGVKILTCWYLNLSSRKQIYNLTSSTYFGTSSTVANDVSFGVTRYSNRLKPVTTLDLIKVSISLGSADHQSESGNENIRIQNFEIGSLNTAVLVSV